MSDNGRSPIHIKKDIPEHGLQINCFGNNSDEVMGLLNSVLDCIEGAEPEPAPASKVPQHPSQAQRELANAQNLANAKARANPARPTCPQCGSSQTPALVSFTDQKTGNPMARYKCQACKIWIGKAFIDDEQLSY